MKVFVIHTNIETLQKVPELSFIQKINLNELNITRYKENCLAENRMLYYLSENKTILADDHTGMLSARCEDKYKRFKINQIRYLRPDENTIYAADLTDQWYEKSEQEHPGMLSYMKEIMERNSWENTKGMSFYSNNFICHKNTLIKFLDWWRVEFEYFYKKNNNRFYFLSNYRDYKKDLHQAYFYERLTIAYFANHNYEIKPINNSNIKLK